MQMNVFHIIYNDYLFIYSQPRKNIFPHNKFHKSYSTAYPKSDLNIYYLMNIKLKTG